MTQSPQRGQTAPPVPPSSDFGSVTTQRSGSSTESSSKGSGADIDARKDVEQNAGADKNGANSKTAANTTADWGTSPFAAPPSAAVTDPALPTAAGAPGQQRESNQRPGHDRSGLDRPGHDGPAQGKGSFAEATTGSLRTEQAAPPMGPPVNPAPGTPGQPPPSAPAERPASKGRPPRGSRPRGPRRARLQLRNINPWTVLKFSCVLSIALFFVWLIVVGVLFGVLDGAGIINKVNDTVTTINGAGSQPPITAGVVFGGAAIIGVVNIVLFIALSTIGSVVYNLCADLVGGIEVTLSER